MDAIIRSIAQDIWSSLGPGYSESVYHCAFEVALRKVGLYYETERIVPVYYDKQNVGFIRADLIIDRKVVIELKSVSKLNEVYRIQTRNYVKLLELQVGYLINFPDKNGPLEFEEIGLQIPEPEQTPVPMEISTESV
jgi:GxxExxY protein